jgi:hypothetical protein
VIVARMNILYYPNYVEAWSNIAGCELGRDKPVEKNGTTFLMT